MTRKPNPIRELVFQTLEKYPGKPKQTLAKLLAKRFPVEFPTAEKARSSIRYYTGALGLTNRKNKGIQDMRSQPTTLKIPKGTKQTKRPLRISDPGKWLLCSDWHVPYHDETALEACLKFSIDQKCENLYLNGDLIDFYKSSRWCKDPRARNLQSELDTLHSILDEIKGRFDRKVYKIGNHEDRFTHRIWTSTPELAVLSRFDVDQVLEVRERGYEVLDSKQIAKMNGLHVFHGHEVSHGFMAPVNVAKGLWTKTVERSICGHFHQSSIHVETTGFAASPRSSFSLGCLCNLAPEYAPVNKWNHGFAIVELEGREFKVSNYVVDRGKVIQAS